MTTPLQNILRTGSSSELWLIDINGEIYLASAYYVSPTPMQYEPLLLAFSVQELAFTSVGEGPEQTIDPLRLINNAGAQTIQLLAGGWTDKMTRLRLGATHGLGLSDFLDVGALDVDTVQSSNRNRELLVRLRSSKESIRRTPLKRGRFLGLGWMFDLASRIEFGAGETKIDPASSLYISALIYLERDLTARETIVVRSDGSLPVFRLSIEPDRTISADVQDSAGSLRTVTAQNQVVPIRTWTQIGLLWQDGELRCLLNGVPSVESVSVASMMPTTEAVHVGGLSADAVFIASFQYSLQLQDTNLLEERALRELSADELGELLIYYRFREGEGSDVFDETLNEIDGVVTGSDHWRSSRTGTEDLAETPHPLVFGRRLRVPAIPLDPEGKWRKVSEGPIRGLTVYKKSDGEERACWPKYSVTSTGSLTPSLFVPDTDIDVGMFAPGQSVRVRQDNLNEVRKVRRAMLDRIEFELPLAVFFPQDHDGTLPVTVESAPPPTNRDVSITFVDGKLVGYPDLFRFSRSGQRFTIDSSGQNVGDFKVVEDPRSPYDELRVAESVIPETAVVTLTWQELVEIATVDLDAGEFETLNLETVELVADVRGVVDGELGWDPSPAGIVKLLAVRHGGQGAAEVEAALTTLRAEGWGEAGLYVAPQETFVGTALDQVLLAMDVSWRFRLDSGAFDVALLRVPSLQPDEEIGDTELFELEPLESRPGVEALAVTYAGDDATGEARQVPVGADLGKGREDASQIASQLVLREDAERLGAILLANRTGQQRSYRVSMPIYRYKGTLIGSTWRITSQTIQGFELGRLMICIGWSVDIETHQLTIIAWG